MKRILTATMFFSSLCFCTDPNKEVTGWVAEWEQKEIFSLDKMIFTIQGKDTVDYFRQDIPYKVVTYVDTTGCTSCRLKLPEWKEWIREIDSLRPHSVRFYFNLFSKNPKEIRSLLQREKFLHPVCIDTADALNRINQFPPDERFQTFLLDQNNKVILLGNPIHNPAMKQLYNEILTGKKKHSSTSSPTKVDRLNPVINLSQISLSSGPQEAIYVIRNTGNSPFVIADLTTSCGCIAANYEKKPIPPGEETRVTVWFTPEKEGFFDKVITVYGNAENSPFRLHLKGTVLKGE